jgi:DNA repair exonuclease SbcCD ATPase subunit
MIKINNIKAKNFLSFGAVEQTLELDNEQLTLILGENIDLGGAAEGAKNGCGKSSLFQMISYALFGTAINSIKRDNLINRTNEKNMSVTIDFSVGAIDYKITRARKPNSLKFFIDNKEQEVTDDAQGDSRETQEAIERVLGMSNTMFNHIVCLNSYTTPFLSLKVSEQREVIEQLLGITLLSEKATAVKELIKATKGSITAEEFRIRGVEDANKRITEQIESLKRRQVLWQKKYDSDLAFLIGKYDNLNTIDIDAELLAHKDLAIYNEQRKQADVYQSVVDRQAAWAKKHAAEVAALEAAIKANGDFDYEAEAAAHVALAAWLEQSAKVTELKRWISACEVAEAREQKVIDALKSEIADLEAHKCYACGQEFHDEKHGAVLEQKRTALQEAALQALSTNTQYLEHTTALQALLPLPERPTTHYKTEAEAVRAMTEDANMCRAVADKLGETDPYAAQLAELTPITLGVPPTTIYRTENEAVSHKANVAHLEAQILEKHAELDPYSEQITEMQRDALQEVDYTIIDELNRVLKHQDYLLDLLTNKKSFVRKRIIEQNLGYLNTRLSYYLDKLGLPHRVTFLNDLSVEITDFGRDTDFDSFSRGERNRVILGLSFAFRDVWENLYQPVNLLMIDELIDSGMDAAGVDSALAILKDFSRTRNKSVWLVSHKEELVSRIDNILTVVKENGFSSFRHAEEE